LKDAVLEQRLTLARRKLSWGAAASRTVNAYRNVLQGSQSKYGE